jgi:ribosomal protein S18 acetylase RimI-like enzyme
MPPMLAAVEPYSIVAANLRHAMRFYAGCAPGGCVFDGAGMELTSCGYDYPIFNSALLSSDAQTDTAGVRNGIALAASHFLRLGVGWSCWFCHDLLTRPAAGTLSATCARQGLSFVLTAPGMIAHRLVAPATGPPGRVLRIDPVLCDRSRLELAHLISLIFELPFSTTRNVYAAPAAWGCDFAAFIAYCDGLPAAVTMVNNHQGSCGFYSVGTLPAFRRQGIATTLMAHAGKFAKNHWNSRCFVLQSTSAGRRLYEKIGFQAVTRFSVYRSTPG